MSKRIPPVLARLAVLCLCLAFSTLNAFAQSQATTGDIEGRVLDPNAAVVPNATVTARNEATGFERTANTDGDGNYRIILLPPGTYEVAASATSFSKAGARDIQVTVGSKTALDLSLSVGGVSVAKSWKLRPLMGRFSMERSLMVVETDVRVVSTVGGSAVMSTVSLTPLAARFRSRAVLPPTVTCTAAAPTLLNPAAVASTAYVPGGSRTMR